MVELWVKLISLLIFIAIIVGADIIYFKDDFQKRLIFNVGVFIVYLVIYVLFLN